MSSAPLNRWWVAVLTTTLMTLVLASLAHAQAPMEPVLDVPEDEAIVGPTDQFIATVHEGSWARIEYAEDAAFTSVVCDTEWFLRGFHEVWVWTILDDPIWFSEVTCAEPSEGTYYWRVRAAIDDSGVPVDASISESRRFYYVPATPPPSGAPATPSGLSPVDGTSSSVTSPTLSAWYVHPQASPGYVSFEIYDIDDELVAAGSGTYVTSGAASTWVVPSGVLKPGQTYGWIARSVSNGVASPPAEAEYLVLDGQDIAVLKFDEPLATSDAALWALENETRPLAVSSSYGDPDGEDETLTVGGVVLASPDDFASDFTTSLEDSLAWAAAVASDYEESTSTLLEESLNTWTDMSAEELDTVTAEQIDLAEEALDDADNQQLMVSEVIVAGETADLEALEQDANVVEINVRSHAEEPSSLVDLEQEDNECGQPWFPYRGMVLSRAYFTQWTAQLRQIYQQFIWNENRLNRLQCRTLVTYEADAQFFATGAARYFFGSVRSWSSNLPKVYVDSGAGDHGRRTLTLGTYNADHLRKDYWYYTTISTGRGRSSWNSGLLQGQLGIRAPGCRWTYCITARRTANFIVPYYIPHQIMHQWYGGTEVGG